MQSATSDDEPAEGRAWMTGPDRRNNERRRTYNRRRDDQGIPPPYFEMFERIAGALERIEMLMREQARRGRS